MLNRYSEVFNALLLLADLTVIALSWGAAYWLRFHVFEAAEMQGAERILAGLAIAAPVAIWNFGVRGLYTTQRTGSPIHEATAIAAALCITLVLLLAADALLRLHLSRLMLALFLGISITSVCLMRLTGRAWLRFLRRRGYNLRWVLVVGSGEAGRRAVASMHGHPEAGLRVFGVLGQSVPGGSIEGVPILGGYEALGSVLSAQPADEVVVALPQVDTGRLDKILSDLDSELVTVRLVPDLFHILTLGNAVREIDGLSVIDLRASPLVGWAALQKRVFDVLVSGGALLLLSPLLAFLALAVRLGSGGPVFYRQRRMGLDGRIFRCIKFRTMQVGAESGSGPVWAVEGDPRRTRIGSWLRRANLDELPQLWNVLRGDMSLVGPRPERPIFIEQFRHEVPGYMLRHKVRAGLTGWAQVHGWRGNTSLSERVEHDIYYIRNWSFALDLRILLMTAWRGLRNAY